MKPKFLYSEASPLHSTKTLKNQQMQGLAEQICRLHQDRIDLHCINNVSIHRLSDFFMADGHEQIQYLHFSVHGTEQTLDFFRQDGAYPATIDAPWLISFLAHQHLKLLAFDACNSSRMAELAAREGIPAAIGTEGKVLESASFIFFPLFWKALLSGRSIQDSFDQANALYLAEMESVVKREPYWKLYLRAPEDGEVKLVEKKERAL